MKRKLVNKNDVIELLIKKANGFYYTEEQLEYEKKENKNSNFQVNMFDDLQKEKNAKMDKFFQKNSGNISILNNFSEKNAKNQLSNQDFDKSLLNKKNNKKNVTVTYDLENSHDMMSVSNKNFENALQVDNLFLTKKKISTHYVPPDMVAIKILFEIFESKVDENDIENLTDDELIKLKNQLLEELKSEDIKNT